MSADNWTTCPKCYAEALHAAEEERARVMASYGKVSVSEFDEARDAIPTVLADDYQTFREDYDIYGADQGTVEVSYSGRCEKCGTGTELRVSKPFWPEAGEAEWRR